MVCKDQPSSAAQMSASLKNFENREIFFSFFLDSVDYINRNVGILCS